MARAPIIAFSTAVTTAAWSAFSEPFASGAVVWISALSPLAIRIVE